MIPLARGGVSATGNWKAGQLDWSCRWKQTKVAKLQLPGSEAARGSQFQSIVILLAKYQHIYASPSIYIGQSISEVQTCRWSGSINAFRERQWIFQQGTTPERCLPRWDSALGIWSGANDGNLHDLQHRAELSCKAVLSREKNAEVTAKRVCVWTKDIGRSITWLSQSQFASSPFGIHWF